MQMRNSVETWRAVVVACVLLIAGAGTSRAADEAPTGFDDETNGFLTQNQFEKMRAAFEHQVTREPAFTARSCEACHGQPITGGARHIFSNFFGHLDPVDGSFITQPTPSSATEPSCR